MPELSIRDGYKAVVLLLQTVNITEKECAGLYCHIKQLQKENSTLAKKLDIFYDLYCGYIYSKKTLSKKDANEFFLKTDSLCSTIIDRGFKWFLFDKA
ncbi:MAG: hypothetical protein U9O87_05035 [Verrucomicrobiota bacterium]|nr:hypothetical protein [Verrucomicrobiota bacterium]